MDIKAITDFLDIVNIKHATTNMSLCAKNKCWLKEYQDIVHSKMKDFNECIMLLCMANGINAARSLNVYKKEVSQQLADYRHEKELLDSLFFVKDVNNNESNPCLLSPISKNFKDVSLTTKDKYNEYKPIRSYLIFMIMTLHDVLKFVDKILVTYDVQQQDINDSHPVEEENQACDCRDNIKEKTKLPHYNNRYTESQLIDILKMLKENAYIDIDTQDADFIYFFSGKGNVPSIGLKWTTIHSTLTIFLKTFFDNDDRIWKKAEVIFNISNLSKTYNRESTKPKGEKCESYFKEFKKKIESI